MTGIGFAILTFCVLFIGAAVAILRYELSPAYMLQRNAQAFRQRVVLFTIGGILLLIGFCLAAERARANPLTDIWHMVVPRAPAKAAMVVKAPLKIDPAPVIAPLPKLPQFVVSFYGADQGRLTASGEAFDAKALTCAHRHYAFGTRLRVTSKGRSVVCRVNDRGPFIIGRALDLSEAAAARIGLGPNKGLAVATIEVVK